MTRSITRNAVVQDAQFVGQITLRHKIGQQVRTPLCRATILAGGTVQPIHQTPHPARHAVDQPRRGKRAISDPTSTCTRQRQRRAGGGRGRFAWSGGNRPGRRVSDPGPTPRYILRGNCWNGRHLIHRSTVCSRHSHGGVSGTAISTTGRRLHRAGGSRRRGVDGMVQGGAGHSRRGTVQPTGGRTHSTAGTGTGATAMSAGCWDSSRRGGGIITRRIRRSLQRLRIQTIRVNTQGPRNTVHHYRRSRKKKEF